MNVMASKLVCLLCLFLWRMENVSCSPTREGMHPTSNVNHHQQLLEYHHHPRQESGNNPDNQGEEEEGGDEMIQPGAAAVLASFPGKNEAKRKSGSAIKTTRIRRTPTGFTARGFHEEVFDKDFGHFSPVKRRPEADAAGFYGDTFSNGFGEFETMKRKLPSFAVKNMNRMDMMDPRVILGVPSRFIDATKRNPEMSKSGFHSDVFSNGFGEFHPM